MSFFPGMAAVKKKRRVTSRGDESPYYQPGSEDPFGPPKPGPKPKPKPKPAMTDEQAKRGLKFLQDAAAKAKVLLSQRDYSITATTQVVSASPAQTRQLEAGMAFGKWFLTTAQKNIDLAKFKPDSPAGNLVLESLNPVSEQHGGFRNAGERYMYAIKLAEYMVEEDRKSQEKLGQLYNYISVPGAQLKQFAGMFSAAASEIAGPIVSSVHQLLPQLKKATAALKTVKAVQTGITGPAAIAAKEFSSWLQAKRTADQAFYDAQQAKIKADNDAYQLKLKGEEFNYWQEQYRSKQQEYQQQLRDYNDRIASGTAPGWMTPPNSFAMDSAKREFEKRGGDIRKLTAELQMFNQTILNYAQLYPALVAAIQKYGPMGGGSVEPGYDPNYSPPQPIQQTQPPAFVPFQISGLMGLDAVTFSIGPSVGYVPVPVYRPAPMWVTPIELTNKNIFYILAGSVLLYLGLKGKK